MAVEDDLRRLSERETIYLGWTLGMAASEGFTVWHEGRLQQSNDGGWHSAQVVQRARLWRCLNL